MAAAGTVAVLLPEPSIPARAPEAPVELLRRHGVPIALATDCNPGSSPILSILAILNMACTLFGLTPEEALAGVTRHAARALGLDDRGTLAVGKRADLALGGSIAPPSSATGSASRRSNSYSGAAGVVSRAPPAECACISDNLQQKSVISVLKETGRARGPWGGRRKRREARGAEALRLQSAPAMVGRRPPDHPQLRLSIDHALPSGAAEHLIVPLRDGSGDRLVASLHLPEEDRARPLVVLIHGISGNERSCYMVVAAAYFLARGHAVLKVNLRGAGPSRPYCRGHYHAGLTADLATVLDRLDPQLTRNGLLPIGFSLGGNLLLKFRRGGADSPARRAATVSAPLIWRAAAAR